MRLSHAAPVVGITAVLVTACSGDRPATLTSFADSASYAIGMNLGASVVEVRDQIELDALLRGLQDQVEGAERALTEPEAMQVLRTFVAQVQEAQQQGMTEAGTANVQAGSAFLAQNAARSGVTTTQSGLQYEVLEQGSGPSPGATDRVRVHYRGSLIDGTEFESSYTGNPVIFALNEVIPGWTEGLQLMNVGSTFKFVLPPELGYGESGGPGGPNATLVFEVELLEIDP
jgi:FKBP-type peptidyl-prolyl cis-trans isomerase